MRQSLSLISIVDGVVDHRDRPRRWRSEVWRRALAVVGRDADQPVHAGFGLQPAIGVVALDEDGRGLDAGLFAGVLFEQLDLVAVLLGPARVHAQQHRGPVLALGAAGAGVDLDDRCRCRRPRPTAASRAPAWPASARSALQRRLGIGDDRLVALGSPSSISSILSVEIALEPLAPRRSARRGPGARASPSGRAPGRSRGWDPRRAAFSSARRRSRVVPVKDASSAGRWPA